jgi:hypothetical protein
MPEYTFDTPEPVDLTVRIPSGTVTITAADTATSTVAVHPIDEEAAQLAEDTTVRLDGRRLVVLAPERKVQFSWRRRRLAVTVTVPTGSALQTRTASATVRAGGRYAAAELHTASGAISVDQVDGDTELHCASGDVDLGRGRAVSVRTASGQVRVGHATGDVDVKCASGRVQIGVAEASVRVKSASGDITLGETSAGTVDLNAASGDIRIGVRSGVVAKLDVSSAGGRVRSELPVADAAPAAGAPLEIRARTASGAVLLVPAAPRD